MVNSTDIEIKKTQSSVIEQNLAVTSYNVEDVSYKIIPTSGCIEIPKENHQFYNFPKYYDMAFTRDVKSDVNFFNKCFQQYTDLKVRNILEPACGPGMFLEILPQFNYFVLGYDLNPAMVEYSKERIRNCGITGDQADVIVGNMKDLQFNEKFDAAIICINSLGYLRNNEEIISHFKAMGKSIKKGGIYVVEISCMCNDFNNEKKLDDTWYVNDENVELELTWAVNWYDINNRVRHVDFKMIVNENGRKLIVEEAHELRLWLFSEFKDFVKYGGFEIVGIYNQSYELIPESTPISGELGALFFVLKNLRT
ncbi:MAG: class I SAM-dependent methyltransferase [Promethearchaeota archaeon]